MKLAIASTTILFAMMAAQAAILSVAPATDVNLVKRAPNGDDEADVEQSAMVEQSSSDQTSQLPLTEDELSQMRDLHLSLRGRRDKLKKLIDTKQVEIKQAKAAITMLDPCSRKHGLCHSNQDPCLEDQGLSSCKNIRAEIAEVKNEFAELEAQLEELIQEYQNHSRKYRVFIKAEYKSNYGLLRSQYLHNQ
ncbi:hypothetical protein BASA83_004974 [Batrachochytrium salamandrivorans]|nr:hypothetical protein BASA83_004974 [Batrachochytrium salamandrivorans]